jgi:hypothetical protein
VRARNGCFSAAIRGTGFLVARQEAIVQIVRDPSIETRLVQTGFHFDSDTEIREGLCEGDLVVPNAGSSLRDGDRVKPAFSEVTGVGQP